MLAEMKVIPEEELSIFFLWMSTTVVVFSSLRFSTTFTATSSTQLQPLMTKPMPPPSGNATHPNLFTSNHQWKGV